jgi:uncharacterized delta-60 repeat protein
LIAALLALLLLPAVASARTGRLDPSFGGDGRVATSLSFSETGQMVVAPDGSVLLNAGQAVTRYLPDGSLDPGFGEGGVVSLRGYYGEKLEGLDYRVGPMSLDSHERMVFFGTATDPGRTFLEPSRLASAPASWAVVMRLERSGQLDRSFGGGRGYVRSDFGIPSGFETDIPLVEPRGGVVDSQDRPVVVIGSDGLTGRCDYGHSGIAWFPRAVVRLTNEGNPDPGFGGGDGISPISGNEGFASLALDAADRPAVAVGAVDCRGNTVFRFGADGLPLAGFGEAGVRQYPRLFFSLIEPDGQLILQRGGLRAEAVARTDVGGNLDPTFGVNGSAPVKMPTGASRRLRPAGVDAQGRVVLVGSLSFPLPRKHSKPKAVHHPKNRRPSRSYVVVTRLTPSGKTDLSFGNQGWITTRFDRPQHLQIDNASLDPQGRLVVEVGSNDARQKPGTHVVLARYLLDS